jgi:hypothetical protein
MKVLIEEGISMNVYHQDGFLPLHRACWGNEKVRRLIDTKGYYMKSSNMIQQLTMKLISLFFYIFM